MVTPLLIAQAYDALAENYEAQMTRNPVAVEMRRRLHDHFDRVFFPGEHVLDLTAGTGMDALYLARSGIAVTALDASPGMLAVLERNASQRGLYIEARPLAVDRLSTLGVCFDGAISTFAGLNTVEDMPRLARDLAACIRPHGKVILHVLNAFCLWQAVAHRLGRGARRGGQVHVGEVVLAHTLYQPHSLWRDVFAPWFALRQTYALSVIAAPVLVTRWSRGAPLIFRLDRLVGQWLPSAGDFFVMELERLDDGKNGCR